jgi:acyl dehydratase
MPLKSNIVGRRSEPATIEVDARWMMAYAACLGDPRPCYMDTLRADGIAAHPLFPVCVEWVTRPSASSFGLTDAEAARGVHYSYDVTLHRWIRPGHRVTTVSEVVAVTRHRAGAHLLTRIEASADGEPLWTTQTGSLLRQVEVEGDETTLERTTASPQGTRDIPSDVQSSATVSVAPTLAHTYSECARIWNPIHTDPAVAAAVGLPSIILHGTASLALAVNEVLDLAGIDDPRRVSRIAGRFGAMVPMPSILTVRLLSSGALDARNTIQFDVLTASGSPAIRGGVLSLSA